MLKLPDNREYTLQVSYMGYISKTHKVSVSKTGKVDFILKEDAVNMETIVVTGTRTPKLLKDVPIVTRVITADEIKKVDATHIGDLLQAELPGIEFSYSMDQQVSLNMQGFGGNAILFLSPFNARRASFTSARLKWLSSSSVRLSKWSRNA